MMERTTPAERAAWHGHFRNHPPGDYLTQRILAQLCSLIVKAHGGQDVHPSAFAPWIVWHDTPSESPSGASPPAPGESLEELAMLRLADRGEDS